MSLTFVVVGNEQIVAGLKNKTQAILVNVQKTITTLTVELERHVVQDKLNGQVLNQRSGALARSISSHVESSGEVTIGIVGTSSEYAAIHEYGGTIPAHIVAARNASVLAFTPAGASRVWFAKRVTIPDVHMPERSFLRSALLDMAADIKARLTEAVHQGASE